MMNLNIIEDYLDDIIEMTTNNGQRPSKNTQEDDNKLAKFIIPWEELH